MACDCAQCQTVDRLGRCTTWQWPEAKDVEVGPGSWVDAAFGVAVGVVVWLWMAAL